MDGCEGWDQRTEGERKERQLVVCIGTSCGDGSPSGRPFHAWDLQYRTGWKLKCERMLGSPQCPYQSRYVVLS